MTKLGVVVLLSTVASVSSAQAPRRGYLELNAGVATENSAFHLRSGTGVDLALAGGTTTHGVTLEARVAEALFPAPRQTTPPGCPPCTLPAESAVRATTVGVDVGHEWRGPRLGTLVSIGAGGRYITESPERASDLRPYAEAGVGEEFGRWIAAVRIQESPAGSELPTWIVPITLGVRF